MNSKKRIGGKEKRKGTEKEEQVKKSEKEVKNLILKKFHKWIKVFEKKTSKRMLMKKI